MINNEYPVYKLICIDSGNKWVGKFYQVTKNGKAFGRPMQSHSYATMIYKWLVDSSNQSKLEGKS